MCICMCLYNNNTIIIIRLIYIVPFSNPRLLNIWKEKYNNTFVCVCLYIYIYMYMYTKNIFAYLVYN